MSDPTDAFAEEVLARLLERLIAPNTDGEYHVWRAWTRGPVIHVVYRFGPLDITWGLARDTRWSLIESGPWNSAAEAAQYYTILDFDEGWPGPTSPEPDRDPETIRWRGDLNEILPQRLSDLDDRTGTGPPRTRP